MPNNAASGPRELAERLYKALTNGDAGALQSLLHRDFVGRTTEGLPLDLGGRFEGPLAMQRDFWWKIGKSYRCTAHPEQFHLLDDGRLYVAGRYRGQGKRGGTPFTAAFVHVLTIRDDRIVCLEQLTDSAAWARALGEEQALERILYSSKDGVAIIRLNRPDAHNALDLRMAEETLVVARRIESDPSIRAVLILGNGPAFSVGGDIAYFGEHGGDDLGALLRRMTTPFHEGLRILSGIDAPIVTAVHGSVAGGAMGYVYAADVAVAAEGTKFLTAFAGLGVSGDGGGTWHLPRLIGARRAAQLMLENTLIDAAQALEWGLISEVVPRAQLESHALSIAGRLAEGPTRAFGSMRRLLRESWKNDLSEHLHAEIEALVATAGTRDVSDAVAAFLEKRRVRFEGR